MNFITKNLKSYKKELILGPFLKLCEAMVEISLPFILSYIINNFNSGNKINYIFWSLFLCALVIIAFLCSISCQYMASTASQGFGKNVRKNFFNKLSNLPTKNLEKFSTSSLVNRFTNDISNLEIAVALLIRLVIRVPFICIGSLIMIAFLNKTIALIVLISNIFLVIFICIIFKNSSPLYERYNLKLDRTSTRLKENLDNVQLVRGFNTQKFENEKFALNNNSLKKISFRANFISYLLNPINILILDITILEVLYFAKFNFSSILVGDLIAIINYISQMSTAIIVFSNLVTIYTRAYTSYKRLNEFFSIPSNFKYGNETEFKENDIAVKFENVNFSYFNDVDLFKNINLSFNTGEIIGLIGLTASGKSTFLNLVARNYDCTSGEINLFGENIKNYSYGCLKNNIVFISQKSEFFTNTIKENILLGKKDESNFDFALEQSDCNEFINKLNKKENTIIYNNAKNLSGGQKQRIALARAFIQKPKILVLDTVTSAFDLKTEANIMKNLYDYSRKNNITTFIASQKASTLQGCDKIIVFDNSKIKAFDTPTNLLQNSKLYQNLYKLQQERSK